MIQSRAIANSEASPLNAMSPVITTRSGPRPRATRSLSGGISAESIGSSCGVCFSLIWRSEMWRMRTTAGGEGALVATSRA